MDDKPAVIAGFFVSCAGVGSGMAGKANISKQIFISYSRVDADFARTLTAELAALGFTLWRDRSEMEGGENWWLQIEEAIRGVETMVLCLSEKALESPVVRKEWRTARQEGTRVIPVIASDVDFKKLPQWMTDVHWYDFRQKATNPEHQLQWDRFVAQLKTPYEPKRVPFMVENLPEGFVPRPDVLEPMAAALLDDERENPKAITTAIRGAGGYGKTTMARAICHDERIQQAFDDGFLWVTLGETPDLITLVLDLVFALRGERPPVTGLDAAQAELTKALADRDILLVIDDCWQLEHIKPFVQGGNRCARLITTRQRDTLPANTETPYELAEMKTTEATTLLGFGLANAADQREPLIALAKRLYEYPLLLRLVNGTLRDLVSFGLGLAAAIRDVNEALDQQAGDDWDSVVTRTLNVSLKQLDSDPNLRERFDQLAVFPEDIDIPLATIGKLWGTGALVTKNACMRFAKLSLLLDLNLERGTIRLHDVIRAYLRKGVNLAVLDGKLLDAYQITEWHTLPLDEPYLWDYLFAHLWGAGRTDELIRTVLDLRYVANKTAARSTYAVEV
ncbi:MAG: TIR domain-containing protein [Anaerolineae bacterium]